MEPYLKFLGTIYGQLAGYIDIVTLDSEKHPSSERWFSFPEERERAAKYLSLISDLDAYVSVSAFSDQKRTNADNKSVAHAVGVDADTCHPDNFRIPPTIRVQTGPDRWQCWWVLDREEDAHAVAIIAKRISTAHEAQGCDKPYTHFAGKLLRAPETSTSHHENWTIKAEYGDEVYPLDTLEAVYADVAIGAEASRQEATVTSAQVDLSQFGPDEIERLEEYSRSAWGQDLRTLQVEMVPGTWHTTAYRVSCNMFRNANLPWSEYSHADVIREVNRVAEVDSPSSQRDLDRVLRDAAAEVGANLLMMPAWALALIPDLPPKLVEGEEFRRLEEVLAGAKLTSIYTSALKPNESSEIRTLRLAERLFRLTGLSSSEVLSLCAKASVNTFKNQRPLADVWADVKTARGRSEDTPDDLMVSVIHSTKTPSIPEFLTSEEQKYLGETEPPFPVRYVRWVQKRTEASAVYSQTLAWVLLSSVYSDKGFIPFTWNPTTPLNLWALILGDTTRTRKTTALRMMLRLLRSFESATGLKIDVGSNTTAEGILKALGDRDGTTSLLHTDEVNGFFREAFTKSYQTGVVETFTDLYEGEVPVSLRATKGSGNPNRARTQFCFVGVGIREQTALVLTKNHFASGFLPRALWAVADPPDAAVAFSPLSLMNGEQGWDHEFFDLKEELVDGYNQWKDRVSIKFDPAAINRLNEFSLASTTLASTSGDASVLSASAERLTMSVFKASALLALHEGSEVVKMRHALFAIQQAQLWFRDMVRMSKEVSASEFERRLDDMERYLLESKDGSRLDPAVRKKFANFRPQEISEILQALRSQGRVKKSDDGGVVKWQSLEVL